MADILYKIVFKGEILNGFHMDDVKNSFSGLFKVNREKIESLFNGKSYALKKGLDSLKAEKIKKLFEEAGGKCYVIEYKDKVIEPNQPKSNNEQNLRELSTSSTGTKEEEINKITKINNNTNKQNIFFTNPKVYEKQIVLNPNKINMNDNRDHNPEKSILSSTDTSDIQTNSPLEKNSNSQTISRSGKEKEFSKNRTDDFKMTKIHVSFSGKIGQNEVFSEVKNQFISYFGIGKKDAEILFSGKPVVIKIFKDIEKAEKYVNMLESIGILTELVFTNIIKSEELESKITEEKLLNALIIREQTIIEIRKVRKTISDINQLKEMIYTVGQKREAFIKRNLSFNIFKDMRRERFELKQITDVFKTLLNTYMKATSDLATTTRIGLAVPYGILAGTISRLVPQFNSETEDNSFYRALKTENDIENLNLSSVYLKDLLFTIVDFNRLFDEIEIIQKQAHDDINKIKKTSG